MNNSSSDDQKWKQWPNMVLLPLLGGGEWSQPKHAYASNTELFSLQLGPMKGKKRSTAAALG